MLDIVTIRKSAAYTGITFARPPNSLTQAGVATVVEDADQQETGRRLKRRG